MRALVTALLMTGLALAQMPGGPEARPPADPPAYFPWWESPISGRLNLSAEQQHQIQEIQRDYRDRMIDQRASVQKAEAAIQDLFAAEKIDERRAKRAIDQMVKVRGDLTRSITEMSLKIREVLTTEQWQQLRSFQAENFRRRAGPGPGSGAGRRGMRGPRGPDRPPQDQ